LDLINRYNDTFFKTKKVMESLDFKEEGKYFVHVNTKYFIEFPSGLLSVGDSDVKDIEKIGWLHIIIGMIIKA
jgi:hypothetical protein